MKKKLAVFLSLLLIGTMFAPGLVALAGTYYKSAYTPFNDSSADKINNIELAVSYLDGARVSYGETFSFNDAVGPRTKNRGYVDAENGRGSDVLAGGVSQLATTLYLAIRYSSDLTITSMKVYGDKFTDDYVDDGYSAVITDYAAGTDFKFKSSFYGTITINAWTDAENVTCFLTYEEGVFYNDPSDNMIGYATTSVYGSNSKAHNIELAAAAIDGTTLSHNDVFSFNDIVGPRKETYGYQNATNGRGVKVIGGGVAQVASTIYLAIKELDDITILNKRTYGDRFTDGYVSDPDDAIVTDYANDIDFTFKYTGNGTLVFSLYIDAYDDLVCEVYEE